jgi:hypothetical protein
MAEISNLLANTIYKNKAIKVRLYFKDRRVETYFVIPKKNVFTIGSRSFTYNPEDLLLEKGFPTYTYNADDPTPVPIFLNPLDWNGSSVNTIDFHLAIEEKVAHNILNNLTKEAQPLNISVVMGIITIGIISGGIYYLYTLLQQVLINLDKINSIIGIGG